MNIKAIIFDWGRTLFDSETKKEFKESENVLAACKQRGYRLVLVSLVSALANATLEERKAQIETSPLRYFFESAIVTDKDKDISFDETVKWLGLPRQQILIVDDRTIRGIRYGNLHNHPTVWLQKGRFSEELPNSETGNPSFTIKSLAELLDIV
ncbi:MAG: HAD family hydrolase [Patescibacteria group bacterium]